VISQDTSAYGVDLKYRTGFWGGRRSGRAWRSGAALEELAYGCGSTTFIPIRMWTT